MRYAIYCDNGVSNVRASDMIYKKEKRRCVLELSTIPTILALFTSHHPLPALDVEIDALGSVAALHVTDGLLCVALLNEVAHERLVADRTPL
jgi:hypothetical protein